MRRLIGQFVIAAFFIPVLAVVVPAADSWRPDWPVLRTYDRDHIEKIALPLGGIGTGTVSLGGRGNLVDWEIMNRPAKGYIPFGGQQLGPFFAIHVASEGASFTRALEGPLPPYVYEASHGSTAVNHGLPRFREASFAAAYPLGQVLLSDPDSPVDVRLEAWNPLIPGDAEASGIPVAVLRYVVINTTARPRNPFPYFTEVMTGFEYTAAVGMLYEGDVESGLKAIRDIRARYDGKKRSPFDEAECGHHYARAMASWAAVPALSGFEWNGVEKAMTFGAAEGTFFWSNGDAWGTCRVGAGARTADLSVLHGGLSLKSFRLGDAAPKAFKQPRALIAGETLRLDF